MKAAFVVNFIIETVVETENSKIDYIAIENVISGNKTLGYIAFNKNKETPAADPVVTPFTESGELEEACCAACAARALFAASTGLSLESIDTGKASSPVSDVSALIMRINP